VLVASSIAEGTFMDWMARQQDLAAKERVAARTGRP